jgi:hypothetical protein
LLAVDLAVHTQLKRLAAERGLSTEAFIAETLVRLAESTLK